MTWLMVIAAFWPRGSGARPTTQRQPLWGIGGSWHSGPVVLRIPGRLLRGTLASWHSGPVVLRTPGRLLRGTLASWHSGPVVLRTRVSHPQRTDIADPRGSFYSGNSATVIRDIED